MSDQVTPPEGAGNAHSPVVDPLIGIALEGRYLVQRRVARGGMATVYEGSDQRLSRRIAIKVAHPGLAENADFGARFIREARSAAQLSHPNVVGVYDQGDHDGFLFLIMEYIEGETLRDILDREGPLSPDRALHIAQQCLQGLAAAHANGLVHRDMKPENVLCSPAGAIKVADFGLARAVTGATQHTDPGALVGTVSYVAPELVTRGVADERTDVYAMGVILFELLTGAKPHAGESPLQVAWKHVHEDVPAPSSVRPDISPALDAVVKAATARDPEDRTRDAAAMLADVRALVDGGAPARRTPRRPEPTADLTEDAHSVRSAAEATAVVPRDVSLADAVVTPTGDLIRIDSRALDEAPTPRSGRWLIWLLVAVVAIASGAWWFGSGRYVATPSVIGLSESQATKVLEDEGFDVAVGEEVFSETVPVGEVVSTDPAPGARVLPGDTVTLHLSKGPERYAVPKLRDKKLSAAEELLTDAQLTLGPIREEFHEQIPEGRIISTSPGAGELVPPQTPVTVTVSKGPKPIKVGDWVGKSAEVAIEKLTARGLVPVVVEQFDDEIPAGEVISQSPASGTLFAGDEVTLTVSKGPQYIQLPFDLLGSAVNDVRAQLEALGFAVQVEKLDRYFGLDLVFEMSPNEGELAIYGSTITLYLI